LLPYILIVFYSQDVLVLAIVSCSAAKPGLIGAPLAYTAYVAYSPLAVLMAYPSPLAYSAPLSYAVPSAPLLI